MWETHQFYVSYNTNKFNIFTTTKSLSLNLLPNQHPIDIHLLSQKKKEILYLALNTLSNLFSDKIILLCEQTHSNKIVFVKDLCVDKLPFITLENKTKIYYKLFPIADGIITTLNNACILVFTADCIPLFIYNEENMTYGLIHAGRKGIELGIVHSLIAKLAENSNNLTEFKFIIGPHICPECYIVEGKKYSLFDKVKDQLLKFGLKEKQIIRSPFCTFQTQDLFYSYRNEKTDQRNISCITPKIKF